MQTTLNLDIELNLPIEDDSDDRGEDEIDFEGIDDDLARFQKDAIIKQALNQGVDLRDYSKNIEIELHEVELESVRQYVSHSGRVVELSKEIQSCDLILARMQEMLLGFQADLGGISEEILHLQRESISLNVRLKNRKSSEALLAKFLKNIVVSPELVSAILSTEINEGFLSALSELNQKLKYVRMEAKDEENLGSLEVKPSETLAAKESEPILETLKTKSCAKIREYLLGKISELRKPKTNVQMIQKTGLLKYKYLMRFLCENAPEIGEEIKHVYIESMGRTICSLFRSYYASLMRMELEVATKTDLIAVEEAAFKAMFSSKVDLSKRGDAFCLGNRDKVMDAIEQPPILLHLAQAEGKKMPYEVILRSLLKHLVDSATSEYLFVREFFQDLSQETFQRTFERTLSLFVDNLNSQLFSCYDAIGLLLSIKLVHAYRMVMQRRRIPSLDHFFDRYNVLLWPRFKAVIDLNLKSISLASTKKLGLIDLTTHYVTRRYAEFSASISTLQKGLDNLVLGIGGEEMLHNDIHLLRNEVLKLLKRISKELVTFKHMTVFLINNYDLILTVFKERAILDEEFETFEEMLNEERANFVDEALKQRYGRLIVFVQSNENLSEGDPINESLASLLARDFAGTWKSALEEINQEVLSSFSSFRNGMEVLKEVLTQLLLFYTRFQEIVKRHWKVPPAFANDIVPTSAILTEIKKYSTFYAV